MADAAPEDLDYLLWMVVVAMILGFVYAFGIGANDVANSFASTVASKSLTLKQAIVVAGIFEFLGSFFLGAQVTSTIRSKIFDVKLYKDQPDILMLGLTTSILTASIMLLVATFYGLPVSTTHTVVGTLMGFSIVAKGFDSVDWGTGRLIFISWVASPGLSGILGFIFFSIVKYFVLHTENAFQRAYFLFPIVLIGGIGIDLFFILNKGFSNFDWAKNMPVLTSLPIAFGIGAIAAIIWLQPVGPIIKKKIEDRREMIEQQALQDAEAKDLAEKKLAAGESDEDTHKPNEAEEPEVKTLWKRFADNTFNQDLQGQSFEEEHKAKDLWDDCENFDGDAEQLFTYVQVFTACMNAFAHGANDVANAIAPIAGVLLIYQEGTIASKSPVPKWILAYGGVGIVLGCLIFGYRVMKSLGYKVTALSPSRGASAELASSLLVATASYMSIPVSSTQSITGAVTGVGCASGLGSVNWWFFLKVCVGWVVIFFTSVLLSAMFFSIFAFSPSLV